MNQEAFNLSLRKLLKAVGLNSRREIEQAVSKAIPAGAITRTESIPAKMTLWIAGPKPSVHFDGEVRLQ